MIQVLSNAYVWNPIFQLSTYTKSNVSLDQTGNSIVSRWRLHESWKQRRWTAIRNETTAMESATGSIELKELRFFYLFYFQMVCWICAVLCQKHRFIHYSLALELKPKEVANNHFRSLTRSIRLAMTKHHRRIRAVDLADFLDEWARE